MKPERNLGAAKPPSAKCGIEPPALSGSSYGTAGCGPACPVVWEGRGREASPYPDFGYPVAYKTADFRARGISSGFAAVGLSTAKPFLLVSPRAADHRQERKAEMTCGVEMRPSGRLGLRRCQWGAGSGEWVRLQCCKASINRA